MTNKKTTIAIVFASVIIVALIALFIISASVNKNDVENTEPVYEEVEEEVDGETITTMVEIDLLDEDEGIIGFLSGAFGMVFWIVIGYFIWNTFFGSKRSRYQARRLFREIFG